MRIHLLQLSYNDDESFEARSDRVLNWVRAQKQADLVVLPELWANGGFSYRRWGQTGQSLAGELVQQLQSAAREAEVLLHAGSLIEDVSVSPAPDEQSMGPQGRGRWNTSVVFAPDGTLISRYRKIHRFGFGAGEPELIEAGDRLELVRFSSASQGSPSPQSAPQHHSWGLATCYDLRFPELFRSLIEQGAEGFIVPAAWPMARIEHWQVLGRARAIENQAWMIQCNTAGKHAGVHMGGHSQIVSPTGEVLAEAGSEEEELQAEIDLGAARVWREQFPVLADRRL